MFKTRFISMLVLLMTAVTGAWADEPKVYASGEVELFSLQLGDIILPGVTLTNKGDNVVDAYLNGNRYSIEGEIRTMGNRISSIPFSIGVNGLITAQLAGDETYNCMPITEDGKAGNAWVVTYIDAPSYWPGYKGINIGGTTYAAPAASTYTVTLKEDTEDTDNWTITPAEATTTGVAAGTTVTATYSGTKKVKSVKAVMKPSSPFANLTSADVGKVIGADGNIYTDKDAATAAGTTAVAIITYVGSDNGEDAPYNHGLALAMSDANSGNSCKWKTSITDAGHTKQTSSTFTEESGLQYNDATHNSDTYPAFKAAIANNGTAAPTGCSSWFLPSGYQWKKMIDATGLNNLGLQEYADYWSSTEDNAFYAWEFSSYNGSWSYDVKVNDGQVRPCLAF